MTAQADVEHDHEPRPPYLTISGRLTAGDLRNALAQFDDDEHVEICRPGAQDRVLVSATAGTIRSGLVELPDDRRLLFDDEPDEEPDPAPAPDDRVALLERRLGALEWSLGELEHQVKRDRRDRVDGATLRAAIEQMRGGAS